MTHETPKDGDRRNVKSDRPWWSEAYAHLLNGVPEKDINLERFNMSVHQRQVIYGQDFIKYLEDDNV